MSGPRDWLDRPEVRFVGLFVLFIGIFSALSTTTPFQERVRLPSLRLSASVSASILRGLGEDATSSGYQLRSPRFALEVGDGCDALQPIGLFVAASLAAPVSIAMRLSGALLGILSLFALNQLRIVSLYYAGIHTPDLFEMLHLEVWQMLFIIASVGFWLGWAALVLRDPPLHE